MQQSAFFHFSSIFTPRPMRDWKNQCLGLEKYEKKIWTILFSCRKYWKNEENLFTDIFVFPVVDMLNVFVTQLRLWVGHVLQRDGPTTLPRIEGGGFNGYRLQHCPGRRPGLMVWYAGVSKLNDDHEIGSQRFHMKKNRDCLAAYYKLRYAIYFRFRSRRPRPRTRTQIERSLRTIRERPAGGYQIGRLLTSDKTLSDLWRAIR